MSRRTERLRRQATELRMAEQVAQARIRNAEKGAADARKIRDSIVAAPNDSNCVPRAFRAELEAARTALNEIHHAQQNIIQELDRHTTDYPNLALILVDDPDGPRVIERRDPDDNGTDETNWYHIGAPDTDQPMSLDTAVGVSPKTPGGHDFFRLYTQDEVDDLLDKALGL